MLCETLVFYSDETLIIRAMEELMAKPAFQFKTSLIAIAAFSFGFYCALMVTDAESQTSPPIQSQVISWDKAPSNTGDWGEMRSHFRGTTFGTTDALAALAVIKPGQALHPAHRHVEEEYLLVTEGEGVWYLDGKEFPAHKGDVLYVEPWAMHGLINTGKEPLTFFVVKWNSKGVELPPEPSGDHGH